MAAAAMPRKTWPRAGMDKPVRHTLRTRGVVGMCVWLGTRARTARAEKKMRSVRYDPCRFSSPRYGP
eukprot:7391457-Prymnesium_polylepis.2